MKLKRKPEAAGMTHNKINLYLPKETCKAPY